jgi:hypothetical protein
MSSLFNCYVINFELEITIKIHYWLRGWMKCIEIIMISSSGLIYYCSKVFRIFVSIAFPSWKWRIPLFYLWIKLKTVLTFKSLNTVAVIFLEQYHNWCKFKINNCKNYFLLLPAQSKVKYAIFRYQIDDWDLDLLLY